MKKSNKVVAVNTDDKGNISWIRKRGNLLLGFGLGLATVEVVSHIAFNRPIDQSAVVLVSLLVGLAVGGKVAQKFAEK
jgi:hypothetical protein